MVYKFILIHPKITLNVAIKENMTKIFTLVCPYKSFKRFILVTLGKTSSDGQLLSQNGF